MILPGYKFGEGAVRQGAIDVVTSDPGLTGESELIERKGSGHPDSICDELASLISQGYARYTTDHCDGMILHHQVDKLMLIGGRTRVTFGEGEFVDPLTIILAGRISRSYLGQEIPVDSIIDETLREYFGDRFPMIDFDKDVRVADFLTSHAGPGTITQSSGSIADMFAPVAKQAVRGYEDLVANDTSFCVAYAPQSPLERAVRDLEEDLTRGATAEANNWLGTDIKVMAYREGREVDITACIPQIAQYVPDYDTYLGNLDAIGSHIHSFFEDRLPEHLVRLSLNTKDKEGTNNVYLTVSGASLSGDIGAVGRGNRTNGLITARKPMSMEGTNGKNPRYYAGFIYAEATKRIARSVLDQTGEPNIVEIVSQNGAQLLDPWHTRVTTLAGQSTVRTLVEEGIAAIPQITADFLDGRLRHH